MPRKIKKPKTSVSPRKRKRPRKSASPRKRSRPRKNVSPRKSARPRKHAKPKRRASPRKSVKPRRNERPRKNASARKKRRGDSPPKSSGARRKNSRRGCWPRKTSAASPLCETFISSRFRKRFNAIGLNPLEVRKCRSAKSTCSRDPGESFSASVLVPAVVVRRLTARRSKMLSTRPNRCPRQTIRLCSSAI